MESERYSINYLHSNMVRFIMQKKMVGNMAYINLHSNMVRFIINETIKKGDFRFQFTFQYG